MERRLPASDSGRPAALILSPEAPYPLDGGGALRTASLLHYFAQCYDVDLIVFQHPGQRILENVPRGLTRSARVVELRRHSNSVRARVARNAGRVLRGKPPLIDRFAGYEDEIARHLQGHTYDVALLEHAWSGSYIPLVRQFASRIVLDLHNVESSWHASCADASRFPHSIAHRCFGYAARRLERRWLPLCDFVLAASAQDAERIRKLSPSSRICVYPNAIPRREAVEGERDFAIGFSGNMEYEPNRQGLRWFMKEVWPALRRRFPELVLRLIGKNEQAIPVEIRSLPEVECTGWIADSFASLCSVTLCVVPLRSGSGTRLKIIEAWAAERAVVSTSIGAEGLDATVDESIVIADEPRQFADAVDRLLSEPLLRQKIAKNGRAQFERRYTWNVAWETLGVCLSSENHRERVRL